MINKKKSYIMGFFSLSFSNFHFFTPFFSCFNNFKGKKRVEKYKILQKKTKKNLDLTLYVVYMLDNLKMKMIFLVHICILFNPVNFVGQDIEWL